MKHTALRSLLCLLIFLFPTSGKSEPAAAGLNRFLAAYTTPVFNMLTRIHAEGMDDDDRYLKGGNASGHITMSTGKQWMSDFRQRDMWSGQGYRDNAPSYVIYRHPNSYRE